MKSVYCGRLLSSFIILSLLGLSVGCSRPADQPEVGAVEGRITIAGEPLSDVIVTFMPEVGRAATGVTDSDGRYRLVYLEGVYGSKLGKTTVSFFPPTGGKPSHSIPTKYQQNSPLSVEVKKGKNKFDFDLEPDQAKPKAKTSKIVPPAD